MATAVIRRLFDFIRSLFSRQPVRLAIVRRYEDANGNYVGELYIGHENKITGAIEYKMVGASLDSLPLYAHDGFRYPLDMNDMLDTDHDFLDPMHYNRVRVGSLEPRDNDKVRRMVADLPRRNMTLVIQNRFIEHVMEPKK